MGHYERLEAWRLCDELAHSVYEASTSWPAQERFGLISQARRAAFSATANLVEGGSKKGNRECARFLDISLGSLGELDYAIQFATRRGWMSADNGESLRELCGRARWMTLRLKRGLQEPHTRVSRGG